MHVAKVVRSGTSVSIELPAGFELAEGEMELRRDGHVLSLRPLQPFDTSEQSWAWLEQIPPASQDFVDAIERIEAEDRAYALTAGPPILG